MFQNLQPAITILIALTPAAVALSWGRGIARHLDDPLLSERLFANRRRTGAIFGVAIGLLLASALDQCIWAIPLVVLSRMAAAYPLRKTLHNETWSLGAYLSFFLRLLVAVFGLWILLLTTPFVAMAAGSRDWIVGAGLAAIVVVWHAKYSTAFRWMLRARPVDDEEVISRFGRMLAACGLPAVSLEQVDLHGGAFANAVALPSIRWPAVVVTNTLIARLDRDETMAILAHELAHLEFYNPSRLRRNSAILYSLAIAAALWTPVMRLAVPGLPWVAPLLWPVVLIAVGLLRARHRQKHETESDLRAAELTGDPEAVVRALTKLYAFARLPRRFDSEFERHATHPSLARRIQAIRAAAGAAPASIGEPVTFSASRGAASVTFHDHHLEWREGGPVIRTIEYGQLGELRIRARASGHPRLLAVNAEQQRREMPLAPDDVARIQSLLDIVDTRLAKAAMPSAVPLRVRRVLALLAMVAGLAVGQISVAIVGLLEIVRPGAQLAAALGASAMMAAALTWRDGVWWSGGEPASWVVLTLLLSGAALIGVAFADRAEATPRVTGKLVGVLGCCSALTWTALLLRGTGALELHRGALEWPSVSIVSLGLAGAFAFSRSARLHWAAIPVTLAGVFAGFLASSVFVNRFVTDPFVASAPMMTVTTLTGPPLAESSVAFDASDLWISSTGHYVALRTENDDEHLMIHAGRLGGPLTEFTADDVAFLDESRLLLFKRQGRTSELRLVDLGEHNRETWSIQAPVSWPTLSIDRSSGRWRLFGWGSTGDFVSAEGHIGDAAISETHWPFPPGDVDDRQPVAVSNRAAMVIESRPVWGVSIPFLRWLPFVAPALRTESRLWALGEHEPVEFARSRIDLDCGPSIVMEQPAMCASFDGRTTRFFAVNPTASAAGPLAALAAVSGRIFTHGHGDRGWVVGWWERAPAAFHPALREAIRLPPSDRERPSQLAVGETAIASLSSRGQRATVRVYSLPTP